MSDEDKIDDTEQTVLIRICEWTEWIPARLDDASEQIHIHNGITGLVTAKSEKLVEVNTMNTGHHIEWQDGERTMRYGLYAMQAILAQNTSPDVYQALIYAQGMALMEESARRADKGRDKRKDLVVVQRPRDKKRKR